MNYNDDQPTRQIRKDSANAMPPSYNATNYTPPPVDDDDDDSYTPFNKGYKDDAPTIIENLKDSVNIPSKGTAIKNIHLQRNTVDDSPTQYQRKPAQDNTKDEKTTLVRPHGSRASSLNDLPPVNDIHTGSATSEKQAQDLIDPVVGWLIITEGPGKGKSLVIGAGQNSLGRDTDNRISINYGDTAISHKKHMMISYDPRAKQFMAVPGDSSNLSYINDSALFVPTPLHDYATIRLTDDTVLIFVPFCGERFTW